MTTKQKYMTAFFVFMTIVDLYYKTSWTSWLVTAILYIIVMFIFRKPTQPTNN